MDPIIISGIIGAIASMIVGGISAGVNVGTQNETNKKNEELLRESWQRDDTALTRTRQDAENAGFSPLAALNGTLGNTNPTPMEAPNIDLSGIQNGINKASMIAQQKQQAEQMKETTRGMKLDNDLKEAKFEVELQKEAETVSEMYRRGDMEEAQYIAYLMELKARGLSDNYIDALIEARRAAGGRINMHGDEIKADQATTKQIEVAGQEIELSKEQVEKIKADINKINDERKILQEQYNQWKGDNGYWANELKKLKEEVTKAKNNNGNLQNGRKLPTVTIGEQKVLGRYVKTESEVQQYMQEIAARMLAQSAEQQAEIRNIIKNNPFLGALEYMFGSGSGTSILNTISGLIQD